PVVIRLQGDADLLEVVGTLGAVGGLPHFLHGREQQADQHGDDGDDDEQLDQGEAPWAVQTGRLHDRTSGWASVLDRPYATPPSERHPVNSAADVRDGFLLAPTVRESGRQRSLTVAARC